MYRKLTKHAVVYFLFLLSCGLYAQSPGGIGRQSLWLKGNFSPDSTPTRTLNFNPATGADRMSTQIQMPGSIEDFRRATIFTVYQYPVADQEVPVWQMNGGFGDLVLSTRQVSSKSGKMSMVFEKLPGGAPQLEKPGAVISTYLRQQGSKSAEDTGNNEVAIQFGNPTASLQSGQSSGLIAEFIVYETILKEKDIARIESYLALKYGITLQKNYVNSSGKTIWNRKIDEAFSHNIAGVGRGDKTLLYQKQGTSSSADDQLVIGINSIARNNAANTGQLNNSDYLLWGDNGKPFILDQQGGQGNSDVILSERKWLMNLSGKTAGTVSTQLKVDTKTLMPGDFPNGYFCLVIDRSGAGDFAPKHCDYIIPDSVSKDGIASFSGIHWDADGSGKDAFSFGLKTRLSADADRPVGFQVYPNPLTDGHYNVAVTLDKPADIRIRIYDIHLHLIDSKNAYGQVNYLIPGTIHAVAGVYIVKLFTNDKEFTQLVIRP
jgi:hypothetical protein